MNFTNFVFKLSKCIFTFLFIMVSLSAYEPTKENDKLLQIIHMHRIEGAEALDGKNYKTARALYLEILKLDAKNILCEHDYHDILLCLAKAEANLRHFKEAKAALKHLPDVDHLEKEHFYRKQMLLSRIYSFEKEFQKACQVLNHLTKVQLPRTWYSSDQTYFLKLKNQVQKHYEDIIVKAEKCFESASYMEASALYEEILLGIESETYQANNVRLPRQIRLRQARCEFKEKKYQKCYEILEESYYKKDSHLDAESLYLLILSAKELQYPAKTIEFCQSYLENRYDSSYSQKESVNLELATAQFQVGQIETSMGLLNSLVTEAKGSKNQYKARFYLAKIYLLQKKPLKAQEVLDINHFHFEKNDPLAADWSFLRAEAAFSLKNYEEAIERFESALTQVGSMDASWHDQALYNLSWAYLKSQELSSNGASEKALDRSIDGFRSLLRNDKKDHIALALARALSLQYRYFKSEAISKELQTLVHRYKFESHESQFDAQLILAEVFSSYEKKEKLYLELTHEKHNKNKSYGQAWYFRGVNSYYEALKTHRADLYEKAIDCFEIALMSLDKKQTRYRFNSIKLELLSYLNCNSSESINLAYKVWDNHYQSHQSLLSQKGFYDDYLYLKGVICSKLSSLDESGQYFEEGVVTLNQLIKECPSSAFCEQAYYLLGTMNFNHQDYVRAKHYFTQVIQDYPHAQCLGDAYFWLSECLQIQDGNLTLAKELNQKVYLEFPQSQYAHEAYLNSYSFASYLQGDPQAITHLEKMETSFSDSPFLVVSRYLRGLYKTQDHYDQLGKILSKRDILQSQSLFSDSMKLFEEKWKKSAINKDKAHYFASVYYRSQLALAIATYDEALENKEAKRQICLEKSISVFENLQSRLLDATDQVSHYMYQHEVYPALLQEAQYKLSLAYLQNAQIEKTMDLYAKMTDLYAEANIVENSYLSSIYCEQAKIAMAQMSFSQSLDLFEKALSAGGETSISNEQKLEMGIDQSMCYRALKQYDLAMLTLSKIINEGIVSSLRVKAMYLRAEIYEDQSRKELAQKQLEAAAKKGGEWGKMAQDKLTKEYGL